MQKAWKLGVLGAIAALGAFALLWGATGGPPSARADVTGIITNSTGTVNSGQTINVTAGFNNSNPATITAVPSGVTVTNIALVACTEAGTVNCAPSVAQTGSGNAYSTALPGSPVNLVVGFTVTCTGTGGTISFTASQNNIPPTPTPAASTQMSTTSITCSGALTPTATVVPTVGPAAAVTVTGPSQTVSCAGSAFVQVTVKDAAGNPVADNTTVALSATIGSIPSSGTTSGGGLFAVFTAPSTGAGGTATVSAVAGSVTGNTTINVGACTAAPAPTSPPPPPPPVQQPVTQPVVRPPSTGDAGLASGGGTPWQIYLGIALIVVSTLGAFAVVRQRS